MMGVLAKTSSEKSNTYPTYAWGSPLGLNIDRCIMDFTLKENIPGLMIFIDFHKAFDSIEWNYIVTCTCLKAFCFGPDTIR